jgi:hypothetical protein
MSESEMQACLEELQGFLNEIDALTTLIGDQRILRGSEKLRAQELLKDLKGGLKSEYKRTSTVSGRAALNGVERDYYAPAVHEAFCELRMKTNSVPGAAWVGELMGAQLVLRFHAGQLREGLGIGN